MATIGELIVDARLAKDMTQEELARAMSVSESIVSRWEKNHAMPDGDALLRLSQLLDCSFDNAAAKPGEAAASPGAVEGAFPGPTEGGAEAGRAAASGEALGAGAGTSQPEQKRPSKGKWILVGSAAVVVLCAALVVVLPMLVRAPEPAAAVSPQNDVSRLSKTFFQEPIPEEDGKPYLALNCAMDAEKKNDLDVWRYTLSAREQHGLAFAVNRVEIYTFVSNGVEERHMGSQTLQSNGVSVDVAALGDWSVSGDLPVQDTASGIGFVVSGTDETGSELFFTCYQTLEDDVGDS